MDMFIKERIALISKILLIFGLAGLALITAPNFGLHIVPQHLIRELLAATGIVFCILLVFRWMAQDKDAPIMLTDVVYVSCGMGFLLEALMPHV